MEWPYLFGLLTWFDQCWQQILKENKQSQHVKSDHGWYDNIKAQYLQNEINGTESVLRETSEMSAEHDAMQMAKSYWGDRLALASNHTKRWEEVNFTAVPSKTNDSNDEVQLNIITSLIEIVLEEQAWMNDEIAKARTGESRFNAKVLKGGVSPQPDQWHNFLWGTEHFQSMAFPMKSKREKVIGATHLKSTMDRERKRGGFKTRILGAEAKCKSRLPYQSWKRSPTRSRKYRFHVWLL